MRAFAGDTLELDSGLRVFLAEIDAPRGEADYAAQAQAQAELEALAQHRDVRLAYGGNRRWVPRPRPDQPEGDAPPPRETAIARVYVRSEGGRWFWLQHELVQRGAAFVRPRRDNHTRASLTLDGAPEETPFSIVVFCESFAAWDGPPLGSLSGARIRARGPLGVFRGGPQLCLDHASQLEVLSAAN